MPHASTHAEGNDRRGARYASGSLGLGPSLTSAPGLALRLAKETARRFAAEALRPALHRRLQGGAAAADGLARARRQFAELGLGIAHVPRAVGGIELGALALCAISEALARGDVNGAFALPQPGAFADLLARLASAAQCARYLPPLFAQPPSCHGAFVLGAPGAVVVDVHGELARLHGHVKAVWRAHEADRFAVVADVMGADGQPSGERRAFVLERGQQGLHVAPGQAAAGLTLTKWAPVSLLDVRVPASEWLTGGDVTRSVRAALTTEALRMGSLALGAAHATSAYMVDLAAQHRTSAAAKATLHSMGFLLVDMHLACEAAFKRLREAADAGEPDEHAVAERRRAADEVAFFVTESAQQMLQDAGLEQAAHPIAAWHEDIKVLAQSYRADAYFAPTPAPAPADESLGWLT